MTVQEIINQCGGAVKICSLIGDEGRVVSKDAIRKWHSNGIPEKHWQTLFKLLPSVDATIVHRANLELRGVAK